MDNKNNDFTNVLDIFKTFIQEAVQEVFSTQEKVQVQEQNQNKIFSVNNLCEYLNLKPATVYAKTHKKEIPFYKKGKKLYFKKSEIDKWFDAGRVLTNAELDAVAERIRRNPGGRNA